MPKTILITGGTGKVGKQLVEYFSKNGFVCIYTSRKNAPLQNKNTIGIKVDLLSKNGIEKLLAELKKKNLKIDYLVNNARNMEYSVVEKDGSIKRENWLKEYELDVVIPYELSLAIAKEMPVKKIINISSIYGVSAFNHHLYDGTFAPPLQYAGAKAALIQITKCLAVIFAGKIQVNCISYGGIEGRVNVAFKRRYAKLCPEGRMMKESEVIGAIDFLISEKSVYITGQNLLVDGGWTIW